MVGSTVFYRIGWDRPSNAPGAVVRHCRPTCSTPTTRERSGRLASDHDRLVLERLNKSTPHKISAAPVGPMVPGGALELGQQDYEPMPWNLLPAKKAPPARAGQFV